MLKNMPILYLRDFVLLSYINPRVLLFLALLSYITCRLMICLFS